MRPRTRTLEINSQWPIPDGALHRLCIRARAGTSTVETEAPASDEVRPRTGLEPALLLHGAEAGVYELVGLSSAAPT